jgi:transcriptional regulator of arginine metabolism
MMSNERVIDGHILNIVQNLEVAEQSQLQTLLAERGFEIPQATLSRRLKKLKIAKVGGFYTAIEFSQPNLPLILNMQVSESNLMVLHTHPGQANALAFYLDQKCVTFSPKNPKQSGILGTIAGDDTVLVIVKSNADLPQVLAFFKEEFPYLLS